MKHFSDYIRESKYDITFGVDIKIALDAAQNNGFKLFEENFKKNNNSFPYMEQNQVKIGVIKDENEPIALIAYAYPTDLKKYRTEYEDPYKEYGHIFDFEVLSKYRGQKLGDLLMNGVIENMQKSKIKGVTLMAINKKVASHYESKYGFKCYEGDENEESPMMYKKL